MDSCTYFNMFETKGVEYLIIIAFLAVLVGFFRYLNGPAGRHRHDSSGGDID